MYFEYKFYTIHLYCLQIDRPCLVSRYIAGVVVKEMSHTSFYDGGIYAFEMEYCTQITDPIMINELDKLITFK